MPNSLPTSLLLVLTFGCFISPLSAVPDNRRETFNAALPPETWTMTTGNPANAVVLPDSGRLVLAPGSSEESDISEQATALRFRFYPLRFARPRPAFGDFIAQVRVEANKHAAPLFFSLLDTDDWSLDIEYDPATSRIRLTTKTAQSSPLWGDWISLSSPASPETEIALAFVRRGNHVEARVGEGRGRAGTLPQNSVVVGRWEGVLAPIVDFGLQVRPRTGASMTHPQRIVALTIDPLPAENLHFQVESRPGKALPGDANLPSNVRNIGGEHLGGWLWPLNSPDAQLAARVGNAATTHASGILHVTITDWQNNPVGMAQHIPLSLAPSEDRRLDIALPSARFGYFTAHLALTKTDGTPIGAPHSIAYGITAAPLGREMSNANSVGTHGSPYALGGNKWVRFWDFGGRGVHWSGIQPKPDLWYWDALDAAVQRAEEAGLAPPLVVLSMTPEWAASEPERSTYRGKGAYSPPNNIEDWSEYCRRVAERYRGRVTHYEIWNEPNNNRIAPRGFFFHASVEKYFELVRAAYLAVKEVDPEAKILAPSGTGHFFPFLQRFLELGGGDYCDIISIHTYTTPLPPEIGYHFNQEKSYLHRVETTRRLMRHAGIDKPIWNTEIGYHKGGNITIAGYPITPDQIAAEALPGHWPNWQPGWSFRPTDPRRATAFFVRFLLLSSVYGVEKTFVHHRLMQNNTADGSPFMPAPAVGWFSRALGEASYVRSHTWHDQMQAHEYKRPDGRHIVAFWRVENETFRMGVTDSRKTDAKVETAPIDDIAGIENQKPVSAMSVSTPPRATYFDPARIVPVAIGLSQPPVKAFDLWGNELSPLAGSANSDYPVTEAPVYLLYETPPENLTAQITEAVAPPALSTPPLVTGPGKLRSADALSEPLFIPTRIEQILPSLRAIPHAIADQRPPSVGGSQARLNRGEAIAWTLPATVAGHSRIVLSVRGGGFDYEITLNGHPIASHVWSAWPSRELSRGRGWVELESIRMSTPVRLRAGDRLVITALRDNSRLYQIWHLPVSEE